VPIRLARPRDPLSVEFLDYQKALLRLLGQEGEHKKVLETNATGLNR